MWSKILVLKAETHWAIPATVRAHKWSTGEFSAQLKDHEHDPIGSSTRLQVQLFPKFIWKKHHEESKRDHTHQENDLAVNGNGGLGDLKLSQPLLIDHGHPSR